MWKFNVGTTSAFDRAHAVLPGAWQMLTLVLEAGQCRSYRDGVPAPAPFAYAPFTPSHDPLVGRMNGQTAPAYCLDGVVDEVRIAAAAWSPAWIRACYLTVASNAILTTYGARTPATDSDADGLPDAWEESFFGSINSVRGAPDADWDGDGAPNAGEFAAGTNPTNAQDRFRLDVLSTGGWREVR